MPVAEILRHYEIVASLYSLTTPHAGRVSIPNVRDGPPWLAKLREPPHTTEAAGFGPKLMHGPVHRTLAACIFTGGGAPTLPPLAVRMEMRHDLA